jgi:hypothetical protein
MVEKFKKILEKIKNDKGTVAVFSIVKMDEITDKWSVILSASWVTTENLTEIFNYLRKILITSLTKEEASSIARLSIFTTDEHLVQLILGSVSVQNGAEINLKDTTMNGYKIHEAYIFESNKAG